MMTNFNESEIIKSIKDKWNFGHIDIIITTFNRIIYLERCLTSLLATKRMPGKIIVHDDGSDDETRIWLKMMKNKGKIDKFILSEGIGTANAFNKAISESDSEIFVMANDDMYFYRNWQFAVMNLFLNKQRCGLVTFYDFNRLNFDKNNKRFDDDSLLVTGTGLGCTAIKRELFDIVQGFNLPNNNRMGYFASSFCEKVNNLSVKYPKNLHYATTPNFALHMDNPNSKLCERKNMNEYCKFRTENKKGKSVKEYINSYNFNKI